MPDCAECNRPLGRRRLRCHQCGACESCCECEDPVYTRDDGTFDRDELGLDPETDVDLHDVGVR